MGCIGSRLTVIRARTFSGSRRNSLRRQNTFHVLNVDDMGRHISPGKLEVTETDLVLHVRGKPSLTWPLRCLRRYGYDNDLFSFESGRRCPTGAGIFAFRCTRAQSLFNILQSKIQGNPGATPNTVPSTPITPTGCNSNNPSTPVSSTFVYVNLAENSSTRQGTNAPDVTQVHVQGGGSPLNSPGGSAGSSIPPSQSQKLFENNSHPLYMNVDGAAISKGSSAMAFANPSQMSSSSYYMNHDKLKLSSQVSSQHNDRSTNDSILYTNVICSSGDNPAFGCPSEVNYAELDLKTDTCSNSSTNPLFSVARNTGKENGKPALSDSKFRLKFGQSNPIPSGDSSSPFTKRGLIGATTYGLCTSPPSTGELGYATIDFDRTAALGVVTRSKINLEQYSAEDHHHNHSRKTRHNSTAL